MCICFCYCFSCILHVACCSLAVRPSCEDMCIFHDELYILAQNQHQRQMWPTVLMMMVMVVVLAVLRVVVNFEAKGNTFLLSS